ncbi:hypothetical protein [Terasakiella pusilla]|uniref:hypothetical protein n=1 Tax=Terasakiella pusilla TaxID=64973 RepID=UPI003AA7E222
MSTLKRPLFIAACLLSFGVSTTHAAASAQERLYTAMQQATLSQQIAKSSCFVATFNDKDDNLRQLKNSLEQYEINHQNALTTQEDTAELKAISPIWRLNQFAGLLTLDTPDTPGLDIDMTGRLNSQLLDQNMKVADSILATETEEKPFLSTLHATMRLGVALQKATKAYCYLSYGLDENLNGIKLRQDVYMFDRDIKALLEGDLERNVMAPANETLSTKLNRVQNQWQIVRRKLLAVIEGEPAHSSDFKIISAINEPLLRETREITQAFIAGYKDHHKDSDEIVLHEDSPIN